jgi:hypothetical protein
VGGFLDETLPVAREKGIAIIGMKVLGESHFVLPELGITAEMLIRYALAQDITVAIVGCSTPQHVQTLVKAGRDSKPLSLQSQNDLVERFRPYGEKLAHYRREI